MTVNDLIRILNELDDDLPIVVEFEKGVKEASQVSLFLGVNNEVVALIE